jgi:acetyl esterase/lipase
VNVDYRLAPEYKFPTAAEDSWDATKWAASNASSLGADPTKGFIIGGTSAGGNITAIVSLLARDEKLSPPVTGTLLMIPFYVDSSVVPEAWKPDYKSWEQNKDAPILSQKATQLFSSNYIPEGTDRSNPMFSPALWKDGFAGLPPAVFQVRCHFEFRLWQC